MNDSQLLVKAIFSTLDDGKKRRNGRRVLPSYPEVRNRYMELGGAKYPAAGGVRKLDALAEALMGLSLPDVTSLVVNAQGQVPPEVFDEEGKARVYGWNRAELPKVRKAVMEADPEEIIAALA